jgi:peptidoglycan biosynthesis protein MviN/MurJ (putative lipid II flippase)
LDVVAGSCEGGAWLNAAMLITGLRRRGLFVVSNNWILVCRDCAVAAGVMTLIVSCVSLNIEWLNFDSWGRAGLLLAVILLGLIVYILGLKVLGRQLKELLVVTQRRA